MTWAIVIGGYSYGDGYQSSIHKLICDQLGCKWSEMEQGGEGVWQKSSTPFLRHNFFPNKKFIIKKFIFKKKILVVFKINLFIKIYMFYFCGKYQLQFPILVAAMNCGESVCTKGIFFAVNKIILPKKMSIKLQFVGWWPGEIIVIQMPEALNCVKSRRQQTNLKF
jgi:hypothetical protein